MELTRVKWIKNNINNINLGGIKYLIYNYLINANIKKM